MLRGKIDKEVVFEKQDSEGILAMRLILDGLSKKGQDIWHL